MLWIILAVLAIYMYYQWFIKPSRFWSNQNVKQPVSVPVLGDIWKTLLRKESFIDMVKRCYNLYPNERYMGFYQFVKPMLMIRDPELIKQITVKDFDHFVDHGEFIPADVDPMWGKNLFALSGEKWRDMRATLSPAFTSSKMKSMFSLINDAAEQFINYYMKNKDAAKNIEMKDCFTRYANDVIASCAFGIKCDSLENKTNQFYLMGKEATDFGTIWKNIIMSLYVVAPKFTKLFQLRLFTEEVRNFFFSIVTDTIKTRTENNIVRHDMLHLLMEARKGRLKHEDVAAVKDAGFATVEESHVGKIDKQRPKDEITDMDITAQALIFFFAGFDTASTAMSFMAYELAVNTDIQERLRTEIDETLVSCNGKLTYESINNMKFMDMVVTETLRKWPPVIALDRICVKPYTIQPSSPNETPVHIEKGQSIWLPAFAIHHDEKYYTEPERFDPERFNDDNKHNVNPYIYLPFGTGPRNCIGSRFALMEVKTVFFHILSKMEIVPVEKTTIPLKMSKTQPTPTAEGGMWLGFKARN